MGFDYYVHLYIKIEYENQDGEIVYNVHELEREGRYFFDEYDSDSEDDNGRKLEEEFVGITNQYGNKVIYKDGKFQITSKSKIGYYKSIFHDEFGLIEPLTNYKNLYAYKYKECHERY